MDFNENSFASQLPQPTTRIPSPGKQDKLREMSASAKNARSLTMPPPQNLGKRKTLQERAGEPPGRPAPVAPSSRPASAAGKSHPVASAFRQTSYSSSTSSMRPPSSTSVRNASNGSSSSGTGTGYRTASLQSLRTQSAMAGPRKGTQSSIRPSSAMAPHSTGPGLGRVVGKREGRSWFSFKPNGTYSGPSGPSGPNERGKNGSDEAPTSHPSVRVDQGLAPPSARDLSLSSAMNDLSLEDSTPLPTCTGDRDAHASPSRIPVMQTPLPNAALPPLSFAAVVEAVSPCRSPKKPPAATRKFLNRESNIEIAMDAEIDFGEFTSMFNGLQDQIDGITTDRNGMKELIAMYKTRIEELETIKIDLQSRNSILQTELDAVKGEISTSAIALEDCKRYHNITLDDLHRQHRRDLDDAQRDKEEELRRELRRHQDEVSDMRRQLEDALENERSQRQKEISSLTSEGEMSQQRMGLELDKQTKVVRSVQNELEQSQATMNQQRNLNNDLRAQLSEAANNALKLETSMGSLRAHITFLESDNKSQSQAFADLEMRMQNAIRSAAEANDKLRTEETLRRKLHNQVQELKGNIRVFCRVRPSLEADSEAARIKYPDTESDSKEVEVQGPPEKSSLGTVTTKTNAFAFDRVFGPQSVNADVFGEISQLVQSALDGYNVCIFCYGQTGSGKTYTMSSIDGMIPLAVNQIYNTAKSLEEKGWKYTMEGSFVEVYNENLNDLLGKADDIDKKKHEIRHDMQKCKTTITDVEVVELDTPNKVESILRRASANRSVAATNANERSSRSHSVFILKLIGENSVTGERSEGTLNLVDLAGSERLSHSGATGERLKETQSINKSLSCLGDVIGALGQGKEGGHVPYRNSKLTYLLQFSLGGNSKTLMFVMISPLQAHLSETLTSLKFATKVHNTHIGTAKRQTKTKD